MHSGRTSGRSHRYGALAKRHGWIEMRVEHPRHAHYALKEELDVADLMPF
jgi:hypothetical protein